MLLGQEVTKNKLRPPCTNLKTVGVERPAMMVLHTSENAAIFHQINQYLRVTFQRRMLGGYVYKPAERITAFFWSEEGPQVQEIVGTSNQTC